MATAKPERCQVRSGTALPCRGAAVVEIGGVPFCGPCAREQEAYFAIGELTDHPGASAATNRYSGCWIGRGGSGDDARPATTSPTRREGLAPPHEAWLDRLSGGSFIPIIGGGLPGRETRGFHGVLRKLANLPEHL